MKSRWRKQVGDGPLKLNVSHSERDGLQHSWSVGTTNKTGLGVSVNSKKGYTVSARGTGASVRGGSLEKSGGLVSFFIKLLIFGIMIPFYILKYTLKFGIYIIITVAAIASS